MSHIVKIAFSSAPSLTEEQLTSKIAALVNSTGFLGVKPGNPNMSLWATEADANAHAASEQSDPITGSLVLMVDVVSLEAEGLTSADFFDLQNTFPAGPNA
jgi:hypothetical protein